jgi:hypothetical protein
MKNTKVAEKGRNFEMFTFEFKTLDSHPFEDFSVSNLHGSFHDSFEEIRSRFSIIEKKLGARDLHSGAFPRSLALVLIAINFLETMTCSS